VEKNIENEVELQCEIFQVIPYQIYGIHLFIQRVLRTKTTTWKHKSPGVGGLKIKSQ
jgi:hypothetical protein